MSIIQLSPRLHQEVSLFKKLGLLTNMNVSTHESEVIRRNFDNESNLEVGEKTEVKAWW